MAAETAYFFVKTEPAVALTLAQTERSILTLKENLLTLFFKANYSITMVNVSHF